MADAMETLKGILGDGAEDTIKNVVSSLSGNSDDGNADIKEAAEKLSSGGNDPRTNLLMSLRPYMRANRQHSIDSAVKLLKFTKLSGLFKI